MEDGTLFPQVKTCPICERDFSVTRIRSSRLVVNQRDPDFCVYYQDVDPYLYNVWVCSHCGYAAVDATFSEMEQPAKEQIKKSLADKEMKIDFSGERTIEKAIISHVWAIHFAKMRNCKASALATLFLKLAWLYRKSGTNKEKEIEYLQESIRYYLIAYDKEPFPLGRMTDITVKYLIGELYRQIGDIKNALYWFNRVLTSHGLKAEPRIEKITREQWMLAREQQKNMPEAEDTPMDQAQQKAMNGDVLQKVVHKKIVPRRIMITKKVNFYEDDIKWLQKTLSGITEHKLILTTDSVVRAVMALVKSIQVEEKLTTEEELTAYLLQKILEKESEHKT